MGCLCYSGHSTDVFKCDPGKRVSHTHLPLRPCMHSNICKSKEGKERLHSPAVFLFSSLDSGSSLSSPIFSSSVLPPPLLSSSVLLHLSFLLFSFHLISSLVLLFNCPFSFPPLSFLSLSSPLLGYGLRVETYSTFWIYQLVCQSLAVSQTQVSVSLRCFHIPSTDYMVPIGVPSIPVMWL